MNLPGQKCYAKAIYRRNYAQKLSSAFKMAYFSCFASGGNLDFQKIDLWQQLQDLNHVYFFETAMCDP